MTEAQDRWLRHLVGAVRPILIDKVERDHRQTDASSGGAGSWWPSPSWSGPPCSGSRSPPTGRPGLLPPDLRPGGDLGHRQLRLRASPSGPHHIPRGAAAADHHPHPGRPRAGRHLRRGRVGDPDHSPVGQPDRGRDRLCPGQQPLARLRHPDRQRDRRGAVLPRGPVRRHRRTPPGADLHGHLRPGHGGRRQPGAGVRGRGARRRRGVAAPGGRWRTGPDPDPPHLVTAMLFALPPLFAGFC